MNAVFVDTAGWMACADRGDPAHLACTAARDATLEAGRKRARDLFFQYRDKDLSFTDCTSVAVMRELRLTTVITTDGHFRQVGFDVLPTSRRPRARKPRRS